MSTLEDKLFVNGIRDLEARPDSFGFETVRPRRRKYVIPAKVRSLKLQPGTDKIYESATPDACNNVGGIIESLASTFLSGQKLDLRWKLLEVENGKKVSFSPDILAPSLYDPNYNDIVEVKSTNRSKRGTICKKNQIAKGLYHRLIQIRQGNLIGDYKTILLRYKFPNLTGVTDYSSSNLVSMLPESITDMVILPSNVFLHSLSYAPDEIDNSKKTESNRPVFHFSVNQNSALADGIMDLSSVERPPIPKKNTAMRSYNCDTYGAFSRDDLRLDLVDTFQYNFPDNISLKFNGKNYPIKPFPVTEFVLTDPRQWNLHFSKNHPEILAKLRLQNHYAARENIPIPNLIEFDETGDPDWSVSDDNIQTGTDDSYMF